MWDVGAPERRPLLRELAERPVGGVRVAGPLVLIHAGQDDAVGASHRERPEREETLSVDQVTHDLPDAPLPFGVAVGLPVFGNAL